MSINILRLISDADFVVKLILLALLFFSVFSWAIIFAKWNVLRSARAADGRWVESVVGDSAGAGGCAGCDVVGVGTGCAAGPGAGMPLGAP